MKRISVGLALVGFLALSSCAPESPSKSEATGSGGVSAQSIAEAPVAASAGAGAAAQVPEKSAEEIAAARLALLARANEALNQPLVFDDYRPFAPTEYRVAREGGALQKVRFVSAREREPDSRGEWLPTVQIAYDDAGTLKSDSSPIAFGYRFGEGELGLAQGAFDHATLGKNLGTRALVYRVGDREVARAPLWSVDERSFHFDDPIAFAQATAGGARKLYLISKTRGGQFESEGVSGIVLSELAIESGAIAVKRILYLESTVYGTSRSLVFRDAGGAYGGLELSEGEGMSYYSFRLGTQSADGSPEYLYDFGLGLKPGAMTFGDAKATKERFLEPGAAFEWVGVTAEPVLIEGHWLYLAELKLADGTSAWVDGSAFELLP